MLFKIKKSRRKLISLAIAEVWTSLFKVNEGYPPFPGDEGKRKIIADFIQLTAKEEKKFWAIYEKLQSKNATLAAKKIEEVGAIRIKSNQPEERSALFTGLIINWVVSVADLYERQADKMKRTVGKKKSIAFLNIEMDFYMAKIKGLMTGPRAFSSDLD